VTFVPFVLKPFWFWLVQVRVLHENKTRKRMKILRWINLVLIVTLLAACGGTSTPSGTGTPGGSSFFGEIFPTDTPTPRLPTPPVRTTPAPNVRDAVTAYLQAFQADNYESMYNMLAQVSRDALTPEDFTKQNNNALNTMSAGSFDFAINSSTIDPYRAEVAYSVTYHTALAGDIQRNILIRLSNENSAWKVIWDPSLILPELAGGNQLAMEYSAPSRGNIYDKDGKPIVAQADAFAFGIQTDQINYDMYDALTGELGKLCGYDPEYINDQIEGLGTGWYIPMCEGTREEALRLLSINPGGLVISEPYNSRYYFQTGLAPQAVGYTLSIAPEQVNEYKRKGYSGEERIGQAGIEQWAEDYLAGKHGGTLRVISPTGQIVATLGQSESAPSDSVYLTLDSNLQSQAQKAIEFFRGAVVVMEIDTGRVLAMASSPDFDPNLFDGNNPNNVGLGDLLNNTNQPILNRATQGQYPLGSVFKVITFSAALESGLYLKETTYDCQYEFKELPDRTLYDWTYDNCQQAIARGEFCDDSSRLPSGLLTLQEGIMRSCNPYFWHIGLDLYNFDRKNDIANMARAFGLGSTTGIQQIPESAGQIKDPPGPVESVNLAIGQGDMLVTPLQVADFMAAIANGGTLYRPQLVEKIQPVEGNPKLTFKPEIRGTLPLRKENLAALQEALFMVTQFNRGTARLVIRGMQHSVAGKTGTAETGALPHAWFAGYTDNKADTGLPDIAIAVIVENIGQGSEYGAPIFRAMVESYYGSPQRKFYDWGPIGEPPYTPTP
jgi:penicillin-binding protein 2